LIIAVLYFLPTFVPDKAIDKAIEYMKFYINKLKNNH